MGKFVRCDPFPTMRKTLGLKPPPWKYGELDEPRPNGVKKGIKGRIQRLEARAKALFDFRDQRVSILKMVGRTGDLRHLSPEEVSAQIEDAERQARRIQAEIQTLRRVPTDTARYRDGVHLPRGHVGVT